MTQCFQWELHLQNKMNSGQACTKGLKFMYSGQILFLLPKTQVHATFLNMHQWESAMRTNTVMKTNGEWDTNSSACINPYTTCQHPESAKEILAKGNSWATVVGNSEGEKWTYWRTKLSFCCLYQYSKNWMMTKVLGKNGNDRCHENSKNMAHHLQYAQCYTTSTSFLNVPSTYEDNFRQQNLSTVLQIPNNKSFWCTIYRITGTTLCFLNNTMNNKCGKNKTDAFTLV